MKFILSLLLVLLSIQLFSQNQLTNDYILRYQKIAVAEMHRTGIPASITLAQGLLESNWGRSDLAVKSNNHFGIKCGNDWENDTHYRHDDEFDQDGRRKESCFRVYDSPEESFYDHSQFLTDPRKTDRYGFLFGYASNDYLSWAHGLSKAGYATDPKYPEKLISIIEKYDLSAYDEEQIIQLATLDKVAPGNYRIDYINTCKTTKALGGERVDQLADNMGVSVRHLKKYNSFIRENRQVLLSGQIVFLEEKKAYYIGDADQHLVQRGENIETISQTYGVDSEYLRDINRLDQREPTPGQTLVLSRTADWADSQKATSAMASRISEEDSGNYLFDRPLTPGKP